LSLVGQGKASLAHRGADEDDWQDIGDEAPPPFSKREEGGLLKVEWKLCKHMRTEKCDVIVEVDR